MRDLLCRPDYESLIGIIMGNCCNRLCERSMHSRVPLLVILATMSVSLVVALLHLGSPQIAYMTRTQI